MTIHFCALRVHIHLCTRHVIRSFIAADPPDTL